MQVQNQTDGYILQVQRTFGGEKEEEIEEKETEETSEEF